MWEAGRQPTGPGPGRRGSQRGGVRVRKGLSPPAAPVCCLRARLGVTAGLRRLPQGGEPLAEWTVGGLGCDLPDLGRLAGSSDHCPGLSAAHAHARGRILRNLHNCPLFRLDSCPLPTSHHISVTPRPACGPLSPRRPGVVNTQRSAGGRRRGAAWSRRGRHSHDGSGMTRGGSLPPIDFVVTGWGRGVGPGRGRLGCGH